MMIPAQQHVDLLNISLDNLSMQELLRRLSAGGVVVTPNVDHLMKLQRDPEFHQVYRHSDYVVCDSQILLYASKLLGRPIQEKISGSDLFPAFYHYYKDDPSVLIYLLGGPPGVALEGQRRINAKVGRTMVVDSYSPPFGFEQDEAENDRIIAQINQSGATVLAVGVGAPKQEKWIHKYKDRMPGIKTFLAIGATINFEAGYVARSPQWMSDTGLEWLHRLVSEPQRMWKRYLVDDLPFGWLLLQQLMNRYHYQLPLGQLLQEAELLSPQQVADILLMQERLRKKRFGELVIEQGWLSSQTIDFFADQLPQLSRSRQRPQPLGEYLKTAALIDDEQVRYILAEQAQVGGRFGEIAVQKGLVPRGTVNLVMGQLVESPRYRSRKVPQQAPLSQIQFSSANAS